MMCRTRVTLYLTTVPTSILTLLAVSVDLYKILSDPGNPFRLCGFTTGKKGLTVSLIIWLYSSLLASLPVMGWQTDEELVHIELCYVSLLPLFFLPISVLNFILLIMVTSGIYLIVSSYHKNVDIDNSRRMRSTEENKMYLKNEQSGKAIFYLVGALLCCWLPCSCVSLLSFLCRSVYIPFKVFVVRLMVGYLNSALNPFLLTFLDKKFRAAVSG